MAGAVCSAFTSYDLAADREVAGLHQETVFSGASVLKAVIMLHAYAELPSFSQEQDDWLRQMIVDSDNSAANVLLAASVGGSTPNDAARGALHMSAMLANLGLQHTYLRTPYAEEDEPPDLSGLDVAPEQSRKARHPTPWPTHGCAPRQPRSAGCSCGSNAASKAAARYRRASARPSRRPAAAR